MCVQMVNAERCLLCRSEARKIEQKELVMEGGVVGIGINLVRPYLRLTSQAHISCSHLMLTSVLIT